MKYHIFTVLFCCWVVGFLRILCENLFKFKAQNHVF